VAVESLQKKIPIKLSRIAAIARAILKREGVRPIGSSPQGTSGLREEASLNIAFVSSPKIRSLNRQYLHRDYVTDVLAFDLRDVKRAGVINGDIAICVDMAVRNAKIYGSSLERELVLYVVHGILHLLGFDDHSPRDIRAMRRKEQEILDYLSKLPASNSKLRTLNSQQ